MRIKVLSRLEVGDGAALGADAVISIQGASAPARQQLDLALAQATQNESSRLLKLRFDDIGVPQYGRLVGATMEQVDEAIAFGRNVRSGDALFDGLSAEPPTIAVHCEYGRSRSAALALVLLADCLGASHEHEAANALLRLDTQGQMKPNPLLISLADASLFRYGRIDAALAELSVTYLVWRRYWHGIQAKFSTG